MKTKTVSKQRKQSRAFDVMNDLMSEFDEIYDDLNVIDELAFSELEDEN